MKNSLTYLTRRCPRACGYCALRDATHIGEELTVKQWQVAFTILKKLGVDFNLILGNETWLLGAGLLELMKTNKVPYALYTTCPEPLWSAYNFTFFKSGIIDNLSCGIDYPVKTRLDIDDDSYVKSEAAWKGFTWMKKHFPNYDCQGTVTVHKGNYELLPQLISDLSDLGVFIGINFIHWNSDNNFDFFPSKKEISTLLFTPDDIPKLQQVMDNIVQEPKLVQNSEMLAESVDKLTNMGWHCQGNPYGGPTIDSDGTLRVCGYRKGEYTPKFTIFDLPEKIKEWEHAVHLDAMNCPGCAWSYPWMFHYWTKRDSQFGNKVFVKHAGKNIEEKNWSTRKIENP